MSYIRQKEAPGYRRKRKPRLRKNHPLVYVRNVHCHCLRVRCVFRWERFGEATRQWTAGLLCSDQFARDWSWNLGGSYQVSQSVFVTDAVDTNNNLCHRAFELQALGLGHPDLTGNMDRQTSDGQFGFLE